MTPPSGDTNTEIGANAGSGSVGALLRASRERQDEALPEVARMLRIRLPYLEAIENGDYDFLPGTTYAVGFIRAYSDHLGLDSEEVVRRFKTESADGGVKQELSFPTPVPETGIPGGAIVFIGLVVTVLAYGGWYLSTTDDGFFADMVSPIPERLSSLLDSDDKEGKSPTPDAQPVQAEPVPQQPMPTADPEQVAEPQPAVPETASNMPSDTPSDTPVQSDPPAEQTEQAATPLPVTAPASEGSSAAEAAPKVEIESAAQAALDDVKKVEDKVETVAEAETSSPAPQSSPEPEITSTPVPEVSATVQAVEEPAPSPDPEQQTAEVTVPTSETAPESTSESTPEPAPESTPVEAATVPEPEPEVQPQPEAHPEPEVEEAEPTPIAVMPTTSEEDAASAGEAEAPAVESAAVAPVASGPSRIVVSATGDSWIQVRDELNAEMLVTRLLQAGDSYEVPNREGLVLLTGNAGALTIMVDGEEVPSIGGSGVVRRGVALDPDRLSAGTAVNQ